MGDRASRRRRGCLCECDWALSSCSARCGPRYMAISGHPHACERPCMGPAPLVPLHSWLGATPRGPVRSEAAACRLRVPYHAHGLPHVRRELRNAPKQRSPMRQPSSLRPPWCITPAAAHPQHLRCVRCGRLCSLRVTTGPYRSSAAGWAICSFCTVSHTSAKQLSATAAQQRGIYSGSHAASARCVGLGVCLCSSCSCSTCDCLLCGCWLSV